jgi:hypothetical protein
MAAAGEGTSEGAVDRAASIPPEDIAGEVLLSCT